MKSFDRPAPWLCSCVTVIFFLEASACHAPSLSGCSIVISDPTGQDPGAGVVIWVWNKRLRVWPIPGNCLGSLITLFQLGLDPTLLPFLSGHKGLVPHLRRQLGPGCGHLDRPLEAGEGISRDCCSSIFFNFGFSRILSGFSGPFQTLRLGPRNHTFGPFLARPMVRGHL